MSVRSPQCARTRSGAKAKGSAWMVSDIAHQPVGALNPYAHNAREHSDEQIELVANSIKIFGFTNPILVDRNNCIVAGHCRHAAALRLGLETVPTVRVDHLTPEEVRAYRIADNRLAEKSEWDETALRFELGELAELEFAGELDFDLTLTGFSTPELDLILGDGAAESAPAEELELPEESAIPVSRLGDLWRLGEHRLLCGDALDADAYCRLTEGQTVRMVFTDPPYNVRVDGHVRLKSTTAHREFAMGVGEMSETEFIAFLERFLERAVATTVDGAIVMVCMDWRHLAELLAAGRAAGLGLVNLCVWNKTNGGMGSLYRSKHEMVCIFKKGRAGHVNNVELGRHGRYRTNVWDYAGVNTFRKGRAADLADHPTVKPVAMVADAVRDVSRRGEIVLDPFGGSGTTLLAAEKTGRRACVIELDPLYVDVAIRRWQALTGKEAVHAGTGEAFATREAAAETGDGLRWGGGQPWLRARTTRSATADRPSTAASSPASPAIRAAGRRGRRTA